MSAPALSSSSNVSMLAIKQRQFALMQKKVRLMEADSLPFFKPHPKQDAFHRSRALRRGAFTGNRFGKTTMGIAEDCAWLRGCRPWYSKHDEAYRGGIPQRPIKGLIIVNDWDKAKELFTGQDGKIWKSLPTDGFIKSVSRNHSGAVDTIHFTNKSSLRFDTVKSFVSNPQGAESSDWDFIHVDEPCPEQMFKAQARGLIDRNGAAWFTLTALREPWITDAFDVGGIFDGVSWVITGSIYDNVFLDENAIKAYEATLTDDEKECRLYGKPLHKAGLVYKEFQQDKHILKTLPRGWRSWVEPPEQWSYYLYIDPHPHTPHMVTFLTVDPFGRVYYFLDMFEKCLISQLCEKIRLAMGNRRFIRARCDPLGFIEDPIHGTSMADEFNRCGLVVEKASKDLSRGILRVKEALVAPAHPYFCPTAKRTLWEFQRYHWDEETGKPVDKDDHAMECLYRSVLDEPCYVEPQTSRMATDDLVIANTPPLDSIDEVTTEYGGLGLRHGDLMFVE